MNWRKSYRLGIVFRIGAALAGYAFATVLSIFLSRILPMNPADALMTAMLLSYCVYAGAILWAFAARSATRAWVGLSLSTAVFGMFAWLLG